MIPLGVIRPCPVHLGGKATGLSCTCALGHPGGHVFVSGTGSWLEAGK